MPDELKAGIFLKNEATDLLDNKGPALGGMRNEATFWDWRWVEGRMLNVEEFEPAFALDCSTLKLLRFDLY